MDQSYRIAAGRMDRFPGVCAGLGRSLVPALLCACLLVCSGCGEAIDSSNGASERSSQPEIPHPLVVRDLSAIAGSGSLRMITFYNSSSYFIHKGGQAGFDFELISRFASTHGMNVEVVIPEPGEELVSLLNAGQGDIVCAGLVPDEGLDRWVDWTRPTNFVQKVVVLPADDRRADTLIGLSGLTIVLPDADPFREQLLEIRRNAGGRFFVGTGRPQLEAEELIAQVGRHELPAVVVDDITAKTAMSYLPNLRLGLRLGERQPVVWLVRENSPELKAALNEYLKQNINVTLAGRTRRSQTYGIIYDRYFEDAKAIRGFRNAAHRPDKSGRISRYDELIMSQATDAGLDWRMVAALIYQESRFYPFARSKADARGLMQVLPQFAGPQADSLYVPEANLRAGLRLMAQTFTAYAYLDSLARWRFTLAEYHAGNGHVNDARRMAMDQGRDPNNWDDLAVTLPRLAQRHYFSATRHGYYRGNETVDYVEDILNRYRMYMRLVPLDPAAVADSLAAQLPGGNIVDLSTLPDLIVDPPPPR